MANNKRHMQFRSSSGTRDVGVQAGYLLLSVHSNQAPPLPIQPNLGLYLDLQHFDGAVDEGEEEGGLIKLTVHWSLFEQLPGPPWVQTGGLEFVRDYVGGLEQGKEKARLHYWAVRQLLIEHGGVELRLKESL